MNKETKNAVTKLLKNVEGYVPPQNEVREAEIKEYAETSDIFQVDNPLHVLLAKSLSLNPLRDLIDPKNQTNKCGNLKPKLKYKSQVKLEELDSIVNLSLWKNAPTMNLFNAYESKKTVLREEISKKVNSNVSNQGQENYFKKQNNFNKREEEDEGGDYSGNNYMINQVNYKRKNNKPSNELDYENYTNSIYNINKKKKKNNFNRHEEIEEEVGFKSAIDVVNKKIFGGGNKKQRNEDYEENEDDEFDNAIRNKNVNNAPSNSSSNIGGYRNTGNNPKKFVPPYKSNSSNNISSTKLQGGDKSCNKEKDLDEKLKGFDPKLIEFIESEILSYSPNVKWEDIAGLEFAKKTIKEIIIWPLLRPDLFSGIRCPPKGLLLFGPPGTGKTMIAKAIASESKSKFFNISASSLMSKWIGESEKLVRTLFALASHYQPSVVFIDEIDSILTARSENECEASRRLKTEFLVQLDGAGTNQNDRILIIGATNRPQEIDDAFIRRLSKRLYIPLPNFNSRRQLIETVVNREKEKQSKYELTDEDVDSIVKLTKGYSGSDMMGVCREAAMMPIRNIEDIFNVQLDNLRGVHLNDFQEALNIVKPSVSEKTIAQYVTWNREFGSFQFDEKENDN